MTCTTFSAVLPQPLGRICLGTYSVPVIPSDMTVEGGLVCYLLGRPSVECLMSNRIIAHQVPRSNKTWPAVTYYFEADHVHMITGSAGIAEGTLSLDVWSSKYSDTLIVFERLREELDGFKGWWGQVAVMSCLLDHHADNIDKPADGSGVYWYSRSMDFSVRYCEPVPAF